MAQIKINNIIYGSNNSADIIYKNTTVEEKLNSIPVFDPSDNANIEDAKYDYLTYGHIIDTLTSDANDKVLSAKQGKILNEKFDNIDFSSLEGAIAVNSESISNLSSDVISLKEKINTDFMTLSDNIDANSNSIGVNSNNIITLNNKVPFSFGVDANGNYGYIKDGADTVTPFKKEVPYLYNVPTVDESRNYIYLDYNNSIAKAKKVLITTTTGTTVFLGVSGKGVITITSKKEYDISNASTFRITFDYGYGKWTGSIIFE